MFFVLDESCKGKVTVFFAKKEIEYEKIFPDLKAAEAYIKSKGTNHYGNVLSRTMLIRFLEPTPAS
jgi:hypothetical protein